MTASKVNDRGIQTIYISLRAYKALVNAGFKTVAQVRAMSDAQLLEIRNIGPQTLREIRNVTNSDAEIISLSRVWVDIAVNKPGIQSGDPRLWRCFLDGSDEAQAVFGCDLYGQVSRVNWQTQTSPDGSPDYRGLYGWIHMFGTVTITNQYILIVELKQP